MELNPYESPLHPSERHNKPAPWWSQALQFCGVSVGVGVLLGSLANVLNGWVCPEYFVLVMGWENDSLLWPRAILQGAFEGLVIGAILSLAFFGVGSWLTSYRLTYERALRYLMAITFAAVSAAVILGLILLALNDALAEFLDTEYSPDMRRRFGWVAGCICGLEQGGALAAFFFLIVLIVRDWRKNRPAAVAAPADAKTVVAD